VLGGDALDALGARRSSTVSGLAGAAGRALVSCTAVSSKTGRAVPEHRSTDRRSTWLRQRVEFLDLWRRSDLVGQSPIWHADVGVPVHFSGLR